MAGPVDVTQIQPDPEITFELSHSLGKVIEAAEVTRIEALAALLTVSYLILFPDLPQDQRNLAKFVRESSTFMSTIDLPFKTEKAVTEAAVTGVIPEVPVASIN